MFISLSDCGTSWMLKTILFIKELLNIVFIVVPIALIVMLMFDLVKAVVARDEAMMKRATNLAIKRTMNAVIVFFVPTIVALFMNMLGDFGVDYASCYDITLNEVNQLEKDEIEQEEALEAARISSAKKKAERSAALMEARSKMSTYVISADTSITGSIIKASGCDGVVFYENGTFYKPNPAGFVNGTEQTKGSAPYGYNKYFYEYLSNFVTAASEAGYGVYMSTTEYGAWRSYEKQVYFWNLYQAGTGNLAAYPGTSNHGWAIASDLSFKDDASKKWAHKYASKYGLRFPMCVNGPGTYGCVEDWHIEPESIVISDEKVQVCL